MKLPLKDIKPNPDNPRIIKDDKFEKLVQSLKDFPEMANVREIVLNKDHIILGGNMRFKAMQAAGWKEAPVKVVDWPEDKQKEFIVKDNVSGGEWDWDAIANQYELADLDAWGVDLPEALTAEEDVEEDEAPEVSSEPAISKLGEVYQLGKHRVMCGDSTDLGQQSKLLNGAEVDMIFTDPPYGVGYSGQGRQRMEIMGDENPDVLRFYECIPVAKETYVWGFCKNINDLPFEPDDIIVWAKNNFGLGRGYRNQYELCFYKGDFNGSDSDLWQIAKDTKYEHQSQKPVALCARAIKNSNPETVLDLFLGSGSTLIACEQTDRTCYGMELDPKYVDVIRKRYWKFVNGSDEGWEENTGEVQA